MRGPDSRAEMAGAAGAHFELRGFFAPLCFPFSLFLEDRRRRSLSGCRGREEAATAEGANDATGMASSATANVNPPSPLSPSQPRHTLHTP